MILVVLNLFHLEGADGVWVNFCLRRILVNFRYLIVVSLLRQLRKLHFVAFFAENLSFICHISRRDLFRLAWIKALNKSLVLKVRCCVLVNFFYWAHFRRVIAHAWSCIVSSISWMVNNFGFVGPTDWRLVMSIIIIDRCNRALSLRNLIGVGLYVQEMLMILTSCQSCHLVGQTYFILDILPFLIGHNMMVYTAWRTSATVRFKLTPLTFLGKGFD